MYSQTAFVHAAAGLAAALASVAFLAALVLIHGTSVTGSEQQNSDEDEDDTDNEIDETDDEEKYDRVRSELLTPCSITPDSELRVRAGTSDVENVKNIKVRKENQSDKIKRDVRVRVHVLKVVNINLVAQTFTVDVQFEASWGQKTKFSLEDHDFNWDPDKKSNQQRLQRGELVITVTKKNGDKTTTSDEIPDETFFAPRLKLTNLIGKVHEEKWCNFYPSPKESSGEPGPVIVCHKWKIEQATFQESMELHNFPFDTQRLQIKLLTGWSTDDEKSDVHLVQNKNSRYRSFVKTDHFLQSSEYKLFSDLEFCRKYTKRADSTSNKKYSLLHCSMLVERRTGYWYTNVMLPLFIVTSCVLPSYAVPPDEFGDRASILFTLLLAQVAYKYVIADKLPNISYMTLLDRYVFFCFAATFVVVILHFCENRNIIPQLVVQCSNFTLSGRTVMNTSSVNYDNPVSTTPTPTTTISTVHADWTGIDLSPPVREVELSVYFLWLSIVWLVVHLIGVCVFCCWKYLRHQKHRHWNSYLRSRTSVWVGPFNCVDDTDRGTGSVGSITITCAGAGYGSTAPTVTLSPPVADGSSGTTPIPMRQATAKAILTRGSISVLRIEDAGSGYTSPPTVTIEPVDGVKPFKGFQPATADATLTGSVASIEIATAGGGYDSSVKVTISPPEHGGTQATATATVKDGKITDIKITKPGCGYTRAHPPIVDISPPQVGGTPAKAAATLPPTREECEKAVKRLCERICDKNVSGGDANVSVTKRSEPVMTRSVLFFTPDDANKMLEKSRSSELCNNHCTVVRFEGHRAEERAAEFVKKCEKRKIKLCNPQTCRTWENYYPLKNAKVEHLGQGYEALEGCKTYQRIVYDLFAGARRVSPTGEKRKK